MRTLVLALVVSSFVLASCGDNTATTPPATTQTTTQAAMDKMKDNAMAATTQAKDAMKDAATKP